MRVFKIICCMLITVLTGIYSNAALAQVAIEPSQIQLNNLSLDQLQQAAQAGDPDAQYALGYLYYYGKGVPQNSGMALNWMKRAAVQGQEQAVKAMALLGQPEPTVHEAVPLASTAPAPAESVKVTADHKSSSKAADQAGSDSSYTLQLLSSSSKKAAEDYIKSNHLVGKATIYSSKKNSKTLYVVGYGNYSSSAEAKAMIKKLPAAIRAKKPFAKSKASLSEI